MPTGSKHQRFVFVQFDECGNKCGYLEECRCMIGEYHDDDGNGF